ncbi:translation initiation factor 1 [Ralstonia mojiangensis]|uniref:translation initiation factor 1 n=1 Tax=Ralstonia mojiangensis TaxID=2953895 RepID=UPI0021B31C1D|nr:translation initiation factor 1 [Ralstonia mojiangensis]MCT7328019.1 translation initiation factor 1 [Ralstonia mojiangensis]
MSASHEWIDMHLTPGGWVRGSEKYDFAPVDEHPVPADAVLTLRRTQYLASAFSKMETTFAETPLTDDAVIIAELRQKFGQSPFRD